MVTRAAAALLALLAGACVHDSFRCEHDADCDIGAAPRCEIDQRCSAYDVSCASGRRYTEHSESESGACFDDTATPANLCAGGQAPARRDSACTEAVCDAVPACCASAWSDACVQAAEQRCPELVCETRVAVAAASGNHVELFTLAWANGAWSGAAAPADDALAIAWLPPAPGTLDPRLATFVGGALAVDGAPPIAIDTRHRYHDIAAVDFDRDGRPTVALAYNASGDPRIAVEIAKLDTGAVRELPADGSLRLAWGDVDRDGFPDGIGGQGSKYVFLRSVVDADTDARAIDSSATGSMSGLAPTTNPSDYPPGTPLPPQIRSFDWLDVDGDGALDVVAFGYAVRVHAGAAQITDTPFATLDCDPPQSTSTSCTDSVNSSTPAFAGAAYPAASEPPAALVAPYPSRSLYRMQLAEPIGPTAIYTFDHAGKTPLLAVLARDLDGDHVLDAVAIDAHLHVWTAIAPSTTLVESMPLAPAITGPFVTVTISTSGAPRP